MTTELVLNDKEEKFVYNLVWLEMLPQAAAEDAGYNRDYGYALQKRLKKHIIDATQDYLVLNGPRAARSLVRNVDAEMPNPVHVNASKEVLDRIGVTRKDDTATPTIKANIFILPEKKVTVIDNEE